MSDHRSEEDVVKAMRRYLQGDDPFTIGDVARLCQKAVDEIERLREVVTFPIITPDATSSALFLRVLREHEKGQPVNGQDLINALMWRVKNQKREISRLNEALRRKASDEAPSFSPNFDERNGIR